MPYKFRVENAMREGWWIVATDDRGAEFQLPGLFADKSGALKALRQHALGWLAEQGLPAVVLIHDPDDESDQLR